MSNAISPTAVFVYGTLMRGQVRAGRWPHEPRQVLAATTRGELYDLGTYPGMVAGQDLIAGELWSFHADQMTDTLRALDRIEGYNERGRDLYVRQVIPCHAVEDGEADEADEAGEPLRAHAYLYARPERLARARRIAAEADGVCRWRPE